MILQQERSIPRTLGMATLGAAGWRTHTLICKSDEPATAVLAFDFDAGGPASKVMAEQCGDLMAKHPEMGVYTQTGVFEELAASGHDTDSIVNVDALARAVVGDDGYVTTTHVATIASNIAPPESRFFVLGHGAHITRIAATCVKLGLQISVNLDYVHRIPWNDGTAAQPWTRGGLRAVAWWPRETVLLFKELHALGPANVILSEVR